MTEDDFEILSKEAGALRNSANLPNIGIWKDWLRLSA